MITVKCSVTFYFHCCENFLQAKQKEDSRCHNCKHPLTIKQCQYSETTVLYHLPLLENIILKNSTVTKIVNSHYGTSRFTGNTTTSLCNSSTRHLLWLSSTSASLAIFFQSCCWLGMSVSSAIYAWIKLEFEK